jgi:hypothetical protein
MNQLGDLVFTAGINMPAPPGLSTYLWSRSTHQVSAVALTGSHAFGNMTFENGGASLPAINNHGDIAFLAELRDPAGAIRRSLFFRRPDGPLLPIALPDQWPPLSGNIVPLLFPISLNDADTVAFVGGRGDGAGTSGFLWDSGTIKPVAVAGTDAPGGGKIDFVLGVWVNNKNRSVLVAATLDSDTDGLNLYRFSNGKLIPVAVRGQAMPDSGSLRHVIDASDANEAGQHVVVAQLEDFRTALYLLDADGTLHLILVDDPAAGPGKVAEIMSNGAGLNTQGQVAVDVQYAGDIELTLALLTPVTSTVGAHK